MKLTISQEDTKYLQDIMGRNPEAINRLCDFIYRKNSSKKIEISEIGQARDELIDSRQGVMERYLTNFTDQEQKVLTAMAKENEVKNPSSQKFLKRVRGVSGSGTRKIVSRFKDNAILYQTKQGYYLSDPLLKLHLQKYRS